MNNGFAGLLLLGAKSYKFTKNGFGFSFKFLTWENFLENPNSSFDFWGGRGGGGIVTPPTPHPLPSLPKPPNEAKTNIPKPMSHPNRYGTVTKPPAGFVAGLDMFSLHIRAFMKQIKLGRGWGGMGGMGGGQDTPPPIPSQKSKLELGFSKIFSQVRYLKL